MNRKLIFLCSAFLIMTVSCGQKGDETYTIEMKDGVQYNHNHAPLWGDTLKVALEFVQKIGELDTEDENYQFYRIRDVVRDSDGNIYVLDAGNYRVQKFSSDGKYLMTIGRKGQGPGELLGPRLMNIGNEGNLYIPDAFNSRVQKLSPDGKDIGSYRFAIGTDFLRSFSTGELVCSSLQDYSGVVPDLFSLVSVLDNNGNVIRTIGKPQEYDNTKTKRIGNTTIGDVDKNDNIYLTYENINRIEKYAYDGTLLFVADHPLNFDVPEKPKEINLGNFPDGRPIIYPNFTYVSDDIAVDGEGRAWINTYRKERKRYQELEPSDQDKGNLYEFHILSSEGVFLGTIPTPKNLNSFKFRIFDDRFYIIDSKEEMCIYEYKIVEK